jgi:hypothetical protein
MTAKPLAPGNAYAVPLSGAPNPTPQLLFAPTALPEADPALPVPCPACGSVVDHECAGSALLLLEER